MSWVLPGVWLVLTRFFWCRRELMTDDFPTFDRPAKAICGLLSEGNCSGPGALTTYSAESIFMGAIVITGTGSQGSEKKPGENRFLMDSDSWLLLTGFYAIFS
jgi:hypothetical protein